MSANALKPTAIAILAFSRISRDPRVLRQCRLIESLGQRPLVIGFGESEDVVPYQILKWPTPQPSLARRLATLTRQLPACAGLSAARWGFWSAPVYRRALDGLRRHRPTFVVANDWPALVVAAAYKAEHHRSATAPPVRLHYDTHEFATLEFDESLWWRTVYKPMVQRLERAAIASADSVSTVGPGIAEALQALYGLPVLPTVIRNTPERVIIERPGPTPWPLRLLYHGNVVPNRGLEWLIQSVVYWRTPHRLTIRGNGSPAYIESLKRLANKTGRGELVNFEPPVAPDEVIRAAALTADVGAFFTPLDNVQRHMTLPNKLFEYIAAGLAVVISPARDMQTIVEEHGVGVVSHDMTPQAISGAINALSPENVASFQAASRTAAEHLSWEREQASLRDLIGPWLTARMRRTRPMDDDLQ
ncbi:MAG: glycosyltransferase [Hyphomicrobiaceae bacterium]